MNTAEQSYDGFLASLERVRNMGLLQHGTAYREAKKELHKDERILVPMNMRDGSLLCTGKRNADWNYSAPHGAGRVMSRKEAKETITLTEYEKAMKDVFSTSVSRATIDEAPQAYKPMNEIVENSKETFSVVKTIKPLYNFKAGET